MSNLSYVSHNIRSFSEQKIWCKQPFFGELYNCNKWSCRQLSLCVVYFSSLYCIDSLGKQLLWTCSLPQGELLRPYFYKAFGKQDLASLIFFPIVGFPVISVLVLWVVRKDTTIYTFPFIRTWIDMVNAFIPWIRVKRNCRNNILYIKLVKVLSFNVVMLCS